jgi:phosphonoacetate hydrolase
VWSLRVTALGGETLGHTQPPHLITVNERDYYWPRRPLVVVCLDGSSFEYIHAASRAGATPFLTSLISRGNLRMVSAAMPTFTNPNNLSIVTGVSPARHGISGNFYLDRSSMTAAMMNHPSLLRAETILHAFSVAGANVAVITAKDKLRQLLGIGLEGACWSAEQEGQPVYSAALSEHVFSRALKLLDSQRPDVMYLSTSDYIQHRYWPGSREANDFYAVIDANLSKIHSHDVTLIITADHGMNGKTDKEGRPRVVFLQSLLDEWMGAGTTTVILPITDPYVVHHGSLGSFASVYIHDDLNTPNIVRDLRAVDGIELVLDRRTACRTLELPDDRIGDVVVCADRSTVLGTRREEHDLSVLTHPLRSHGGLAEREVPMLFNRSISNGRAFEPSRNYDAFWIGLNAIAS